MSGYRLSEAQRQQFARDGVLVIPGFYDRDSEIVPIQRAIHEIIQLIALRHGLQSNPEPFAPERFDRGYAALVAADRSYGGEVYDAIKQIPAFLRLICSPRAEALFRQVRGTDLPGVGAASYGIRIDAPHEEAYRAHWHQEFIFQPQSMDGVTFWTPLAPVTQAMGPVIFCAGSHRDGLRPVSRQGSYSDKAGAYRIGIVDDETITGSYPQLAPLTVPGDLVIIDFLTIHQSGFNVSERCRWTVQSRFFNFREPTGIEIGWKASVTAGTDVASVFESYFREEAE